MGALHARISASTSSVGMPRSITQVRPTLPYWVSIRLMKSRSVVLSAVLPGITSVGQRQAVGRHDQGDDHLNAIRPLVPAITKAPLAGRRRIAFEIRTGQIIEQNFEFGLEQSLPALLQETEEIRFVHQQLVQAAIQIVPA